MLVAKITVTGTQIRAEKLMPITSGMIGAQVEVTFDESWDEYTKAYIWNNGRVTKDDLDATGTIPAEVLERPGGWLRFGVYGTKDGCALPTLWVTIGSVDPGADPSGDESADPSLPVWAKLRAEIEALKKAGDISPMIVTIDVDAATADATFEQIMETVNGGRPVYADFGMGFIRLGGFDETAVLFVAPVGGSIITVRIDQNNKVTYYTTDSVSQEYVDIEINAVRGEIPTDEHINGLIDTALGVIENGTY